MELFQSVLGYLADLPPIVTYLVLAGGAALENVVPPVPADTFVLAGAFLAATGRADPWLVFFATWLANVSSALGVYALARKWGTAFFDRPAGRWLLRPRQLERIARFYERWGPQAIAVSRCLPAFRAVVPVFAGISRVTFPRVALPVALASAGWYGALVLIGTTAGRNIDRILGAVDRAGVVLVSVAAAIGAFLVYLWWKSRGDPDRTE
jgi:membrane protein DedA with SNARE-associated domain